MGKRDFALCEEENPYSPIRVDYVTESMVRGSLIFAKDRITYKIEAADLPGGKKFVLYGFYDFSYHSIIS